ncbi:MAG: hypothetical protein ABIR08_05365 [Sphingomonas sp.]
MSAYRIFYAVDALAALVLAYFFLDGLRCASDAADIAPIRVQLDGFARSQPNQL